MDEPTKIVDLYEGVQEEGQDGDLVSEADRMGFQGEERKLWFSATPRQRGLIKARTHRRLKDLARTHGLNPEQFVQMMPTERAEAVANATVRYVKRQKKVIDKHLARSEEPAPSEDEDETEEEEDDDPNDDDVDDDEEDEPAANQTDAPMRVYTTAAEVPPIDMNAKRRGGVTVGPIMERVDDLFGDRPPRTLADVYARWPMMGRPGGDDFYLRVERVTPKQFGGVKCAGYLGDIRGLVVNEEQFGRYFGGEEYRVQLYGPDPKGRLDANGDKIIKALTDPIQIIVAHLHPNLRYLPTKKLQQDQERTSQMDPFNPFAAVMAQQSGYAAPTTPADASIFKTHVEFVSKVLDDANKKPKEDQAPKHMVDLLGKTTELQVQQAQRSAEQTERILRDQVEQARKDSERRDRELEELKKRLEAQKSNGSDQLSEMMKYRDGDAARVHDHYRVEMTSMRESYQQQMGVLTAQHNQALQRAEERMREMEQTHRTVMDNERRRSDEEEKRLKSERDDIERRMLAEIERVRKEEREDAKRRVDEALARSKERLDDLAKAHERELRTEKSNAEVKVSTEIAKITYELNHLREKLSEREKELEEAKAEIDEQKDPSAVLEKWETQAKKLGFRKKGDEDSEPKTFWQHLGVSAGQGLGQALGNMDVGQLVGALTTVAAGRKAQAQPGQRQMQPGQRPAGALPPHQQQQAQQQQAPHQQRRAGMRWASQGGAPIQKQHPTVPAHQAPQPQQTHPAAHPPPAPEQPVQDAVPQDQQAAAPEQPAQPQPEQRRMPELPKHRLIEAFGPEAIMGFLQSAESAINQGVQPDHFSTLFCAQYPEAAVLLVSQFRPNDAKTFVEQMAEQFPDALGSPILTKVGQTWMEKLWESMRGLTAGGEQQVDAQQA